MRPHIVFLGFVIAASVIGGRLFSLQVKDYGLFAAFARGQQQVFETINQGIFTWSFYLNFLMQR